MRADDLRAETIAQITEWERTEPRSRPEHEAAEAFTRSFAELDALMREGKEPPPSAWAPGIGGMSTDYMLVKISDVSEVLPRVEHQVSLTPWEKAAVRRLREATDEAAKEHGS
jgi:hypothetical protein